MKFLPTDIGAIDDALSVPTDGVIEAVRTASGRFAVLGAGGKMGFHLSRMIQRALKTIGRPDRVITVSRFGAPEKLAHFREFGFDVHRADLSDAGQVSNLPDAENVFFLAGMKFGTEGNRELLHQMNELTPQIVAERYKDSRIVALSTGCVYEFVTPGSGGSTETSKTNPPGDYAESCLGRERAFSDNSKASGTPTSLIRLNYSNELRYGVLVDIATKVLRGEPVGLETGYVNVIWQHDAVGHVVQSLNHADSPPFVVNVTGAEILTVKDLAMRFAARFGRDPKFVGEPTETAWLNNASMSHELFGPPRTSTSQMIEWIADWLMAGGGTLGKPTQFEKRDGDY